MSHWHGNKHNSYVTNIASKYSGILFLACTYTPLFSQLNTLTIYDIHNLIKALSMYNFATKKYSFKFW